MDRRGGPVSCPVCTLYMREGVTLQHHLNTHPKEQVIAALVKISAGEYIYKLASVCDRPSSAPVTVSSQELPVVGRSTPSVSAQFPQAGSSHFTTAITYQHFLSSNGVPHYVSMPAIISETGTSPASPNQASFMQMVYNPYMMHQQQQQQQMQVLNSIPPPPHQQTYIRHVLSPSPSLFPPPSIHPQAMEITPANLTINIPFSTDTLATEFTPSTEPQTFTTAQASNLSMPAQKHLLPPAIETATTEASCSTTAGTVIGSFAVLSQKEQATAPAATAEVLNSTAEENQSTAMESSTSGIVEITVRDEEQQTEGSSFTCDTGTESFDISAVDAPNITCVTACQSGKDETTQTTNAYDEVDMEPTLRDKSDSESEDEANDNENNEDDNETDNHELQVAVAESEAGNSSLLTTEAQIIPEQSDLASEPFSSAEETNNTVAQQSSNTDSLNTSITSDMLQISGLVRNALEIQPPAVSDENNGEYMSCEYENQDSNESPENLSKRESVNNAEGQKPGSSGYGKVEPTDSYTIMNIDGLQVAVPDGIVNTSESIMVMPGKSTNAAEAGQSAEQSEASLSSEPVLNIHTDEMMPPRGELSEQESVGGNDTSMWAQAFTENEASTPCYLLARESWEASDGSDADVPPENDTENNQDTACALPLKLQLKQSLKEPKVFTCAVCNENFNCPKERRVHQSTYHNSVGESSGGETSADLESKGKDELQRMDVGEQNETGIKRDHSCLGEEDKGESAKRLKEGTEELQEIVPENVTAKAIKEKNSVHGYLCSRCPELFPTSKLRTDHELQAHQITKDAKNACKTCRETFETEASFKAHLQIHPLECSHCGKCFKRRQNLDLHIRRHLDIKPYKCTVCDKAFVTKQKLEEHTNTHTGNSPIKCPMCDETFRRYSNLIQHKNRHHLKKKKKIKDFICRCGEIFHSKKKLEWHKETHDVQPKRCTYCPERFVHVASLTRHIRKAHDCRYVPEGGRRSENVECTICGYVFLKGSLQVHMRMHKGERPFSCQVCGKDFTTKWNLQLHRWTHATRSSKPFKCKTCKSAFFRYTDLTAHENSHRNVRPFTCNYCGSRFIRKYNCLRHVREHEAGKTFRCTVCNKTFHRSYYLKEHLRVHTGVRPFSCHICGKSSTTKSNHNKHVKIHHAREQVNTEG